MLTTPARRLITDIATLILLAGGWVCATHQARGADCNGNGVDDATDIAHATSLDCNGNGIPDECDLSGAHFAAPVYYDVPSGAFIVRADQLDGLSGPDVVVSSGQGGMAMSVLLDQDAGLLGTPVDYPAPDWPMSFALIRLTPTTPSIVVARSPAASILPGLGNGTFGPYSNIANYRVHSIASADLDGDGDQDLVMTKWYYGWENSKVLVWEGNGLGGFAETREYTVGQGADNLALADLDGDHDIDFAVTDGKSACSCIHIRLNNGDATFGGGSDRVIAGVGNYMAAADLDGDGDNDLAVVYNSYVFTVLLNNGDATFTDTTTRSTERLAQWLEPVDIDRDGDIDIAMPTNGSVVSLLLNRGNATFGPYIRIPIETPTQGKNPTCVAAVDLNGDAWPDLVTANADTDDLTVLINQSTAPASLDTNRNGIPDECDCARTRDWDSDTDVDAADFDAFILCATRSGVAPAPGCETKDLDCDTDVDLNDFGLFQRCYTGAGVPAPTNCR